MSFSEEEVLKLLKVQALTLKNLEDTIRMMSYEIRRHRRFAKQMILSIKESKLSIEEKEEVPSGAELPSNVLQFPVE